MTRAPVFRLAALLLVAAAVPRAARAQSYLDQGVFVIKQDGNEIGREEFAVRTTPGRQGAGGVLAVSTARYRDHEYRAALELTSDNTPVSYQLDVTTGGRVTERLSSQFGRGRCAVRIASPSGEVAREFPIPARAAVLDDDAFDQFSFVPRPGAGASQSVGVVRPRQSGVVGATVRAVGDDSVLVGQRLMAARHYLLSLPAGDDREFWISTAGDLLKVTLRARGVTATRLAPPSR